MYCFVLHIGIMYILQITKRRIGPVLALNVQKTRSGRMFGRVCMLKASTGLVWSLCYLCNIYILYSQYVTQNSTFTRQNTLSFVILILIIMYTLVSGVHVCDKVI